METFLDGGGSGIESSILLGRRLSSEVGHYRSRTPYLVKIVYVLYSLLMPTTRPNSRLSSVEARLRAGTITLTFSPISKVVVFRCLLYWVIERLLAYL